MLAEAVMARQPSRLPILIRRTQGSLVPADCFFRSWSCFDGDPSGVSFLPAALRLLEATAAVL